ncbi:hypothetical protein EDC94DRAFT_346253 [Helicostylum pulchrum]|nr:hypothetical protein EDC94DRAFT_346253 [Helicostylum pulchrum]
MLSLEDQGSLEDPNQRIFFLKQLQDEIDVETEPTVLSEVQDAAISKIFHNLAEEERVSLSEPENNVLRYILASASDQLAFRDDLSNYPSPAAFIKFEELYQLKKVIDATYGNVLRDIEPTPSILNDGRIIKPNTTLRVKTALSIIMSHTYDLANQLVGPMRLTLVEQNEYPNIESAKKGTWTSVHPQTKNNYMLLLETQVLRVHNLPIARCQDMWLANFFLSKAFNRKRNAGW